MSENRHLPFAGLAAVVVALGVLPAVFSASLADPVQLAGAYFAWAVASYLAASGGSLAAAFTFRRGDPTRVGWFALAASYLVIIPVTLRLGARPTGLYAAGISVPWLATGSSVASGALAVAAFVLLARSWRSSGLDATSPAGRASAAIIALAIAIALVAPDLREEVPRALAGDPLAAGEVLGDLLDGAVFVVAVPILRAALALGGGLVAWPWVFLTLSLAAWLGYDATIVFGGRPGVDGRTLRVAAEMLRSLGAAFVFAAGVAQRWVMIAARER